MAAVDRRREDGCDGERGAGTAQPGDSADPEAPQGHRRKAGVIAWEGDDALDLGQSERRQRAVPERGEIGLMDEAGPRADMLEIGAGQAVVNIVADRRE